MTHFDLNVRRNFVQKFNKQLFGPVRIGNLLDVILIESYNYVFETAFSVKNKIKFDFISKF